MKCIITLALIILTKIGYGQAPKDKAIKPLNPYIESTNFNKSISMDKQEFWKIIDYAFINSNGNFEVQATLIVRKLTEYTLDQIIDFEKIFRIQVIEADDYKVMAAQKIIEGWVTDDPYLYFRCWLIGQGEKTFKETLKSPEYLADIVSPGMNTQFEDLLYVATKAYFQKTGKNEEDETCPRSKAIKDGLDYDFGAPPTKGTDWTTDQLPKLYPKLWSKFR
jgi:hypothetical protein